MSVPTLPPDPLPVPELTPIPTSLNIQSSEPLLHSIPSSPLSTSSMPSLITASASGTEGNLSDVTNISSLSDIYQDGRPSQPINGSITSSDRMPPRQSHPSALPSSLCYPQRAGCPNNGTSMPTSPVPSQRDDVECHSPLTPQAPQLEVSSITEVGPTVSTQSSTRDPPGEVSDTRQQEPPFMTDGRGRVVWSRSGVKRGSSPPATRGQDRAPNAAGDRE
ncbi:hypothetical protein BJV78DRAFT_578773 [Lactifluus subvellereus]|nr:hypothetical protein BJV78DRAFT_578773 [Lactifluus subvellereus]